MIRSLKFSLGLSIPVVSASSQKDEESINFSLKPSEIPIYDHDLFPLEYHKKEKGKIHNGISTVRKEVESMLNATKGPRDSLCNIYETGKAHTLSSIDYIMEEENMNARIGAISAGGLAGLLLAVRRGFFKKILFASIGAGAVASAFYPKHAIEISEDIFQNAKIYGLIGYNFIIGAKPQRDELKLIPPTETKSAPPKPSPDVSKQNETQLETEVLHTSSPPDSQAPVVSLEERKNTDSDEIKKEESKDVVIKAAESVQQAITGDIGQSNPEDKDMYTTRSK